MYDPTNITHRLDLKWRSYIIAVFGVGAVVGVLQMGRTFALNDASASLREAVRTRDFAGTRAALKNGAYPDEPAFAQGPMDELASSMPHGRYSHYTVLNMACDDGNVEMAKVLLNAYSTLSLRKVRATAALFDAANGDVVRLLVAHHADVNVRHERGETPLYTAITTNRAEVALALLECGANPNARCGDGSTALMLAAASGNATLVAALMARGADPAIRDGNGDDTWVWLRASSGYMNNAPASIYVGQLLSSPVQRARPGR